MANTPYPLYFDAAYYLEQNPDLAAAGIDTPEEAWWHYLTYGANEAMTHGGQTRAPAPWFNVQYYLQNNPDLQDAGLTPAQLFEHFVNYGMQEWRAPSPDFPSDPATL